MKHLTIYITCLLLGYISQPLQAIELPSVLQDIPLLKRQQAAPKPVIEIENFSDYPFLQVDIENYAQQHDLTLLHEHIAEPETFSGDPCHGGSPLCLIVVPFMVAGAVMDLVIDDSQDRIDLKRGDQLLYQAYFSAKGEFLYSRQYQGNSFQEYRLVHLTYLKRRLLAPVAKGVAASSTEPESLVRHKISPSVGLLADYRQGILHGHATAATNALVSESLRYVGEEMGPTILELLQRPETLDYSRAIAVQAACAHHRQPLQKLSFAQVVATSRQYHGDLTATKILKCLAESEQELAEPPAPFYYTAIKQHCKKRNSAIDRQFSKFIPFYPKDTIADSTLLACRNKCWDDPSLQSDPALPTYIGQCQQPRDRLILTLALGRQVPDSELQSFISNPDTPIKEVLFSLDQTNVEQFIRLALADTTSRHQVLSSAGQQPLTLNSDLLQQILSLYFSMSLQTGQQLNLLSPIQKIFFNNQSALAKLLAQSDLKNKQPDTFLTNLLHALLGSERHFRQAALYAYQLNDAETQIKKRYHNSLMSTWYNIGCKQIFSLSGSMTEGNKNTITCFQELNRHPH